MSNARISSYVPLALEFAAQSINLHAAVAARLGIHVTDLRGLRLLGNGPLNARDLGRQVGLTDPAVTALVDRLEKAGYVRRERGSSDRRLVTIYADPEKTAYVNSLYKGQHRRMAKLLSSFTEEQYETILCFLRETTHILSEEAEALRHSATGGHAE